MASLSRASARALALRASRASSSSSASAPSRGLRDAVIVAFARTPIGTIGGSLASVTAPQLGSVAIRGALARAGVSAEEVQEVIFGNVVSAGVGQAPARQAARGAGIPDSAVCTTINKVCASGMKAVMYAAQSIALGHADVVVAGGMESMSLAPYLAPSARYGSRFGHATLLDAVVKDGLWDPYSDIHMGMCAEKTAAEMGVTRAAQDAYARGSYERAAAAAGAGVFAREIVPVAVKGRGGKEALVEVDEEWGNANFAKMGALKAAFKKDGTITAANASKLNDGAAALVLMSRERARALGVTPLALVRGYGDAEAAPIDFSTAPAKAVPIALARAGVTMADAGCHEVNEAFSVVALVNAQLMGIDLSCLNIHGGAVALGHPIGASGARIVGSLMSALTARAPLNIHFVAHSHDDVGWDETYLQYYNGNGPIGGRNVSQILRAVTAGLLANASRRFVYVEQAFFQIWFETQDSDTQTAVKGLVASGQLTFLNGGWSMHDEANPTFVDMLDNTALGHRHIVENFGMNALPRAASQLDPFGHSAFQGVLSSPLGGYQGVIWAREAEDYKQLMCANKSIERIWQPSPSLGSSALAFQSIFVDEGYGYPGECSRCSGAPKDADCNYSWGAKDVGTLIADILQFRAPWVRGNDITLQFGDDFEHENAPQQMAYIDGLIDALNADPQGRFKAFYSTPVDYIASKLALPSLPLQEGDFFPYNDDTEGHNLWTGYFTSRPAYKGFVRESSSYMQSARQLQALVGGVADAGPSNPLFRLERAMGVAQHHDSVAGTAMENVNRDYALILEGGRVDAYASIAASFAAATGYSGAPFALCPLNNVTLCPALESGSAAVTVVYNSLGQAAPASPVRLSVGLPAGVASYAVFDSTGAPVTAQLVPLSPRDALLRTLYGGSATPTQWLCFQGALPAAGFSAFFIVPKASVADAPTTHVSVVTAPIAGAAVTQVTNGRISLNISAATGMLSGFADAVTGVTLPLVQEWAAYEGFDGHTNLNGSSQSSGAYIFRPARPVPDALSADAATVTFVSGPVVNEAQIEYSYISESLRLWAGSAEVEIEWTVGPVATFEGESREVITRYRSGLPTGGVWTTDSNCREAQLRQRNYRKGWDDKGVVTEPVSSNYFPCNCLIKTSSGDVTLAVAVDRSQGSTSLEDGTLELMVHRRMHHDDGRGVGEPLNEPGLDGQGLVIRGRHWLLVAPAASAPAGYKALHAKALSLPTAVVAHAPLGALSPAAWLAAYKPTRSLLPPAALPPALHLTTVHVLGPTTLLLRLSHVYDAGEGPAAAPVSVDLATLFLSAGVTITSAVDMTLGAGEPLAHVPRYSYAIDGASAPVTLPMLPPAPSGPGLSVTLDVQQIRTLMCTIARA